MRTVWPRSAKTPSAQQIWILLILTSSFLSIDPLFAGIQCIQTCEQNAVLWVLEARTAVVLLQNAAFVCKIECVRSGALCACVCLIKSLQFKSTSPDGRSYDWIVQTLQSQTPSKLTAPAVPEWAMFDFSFRGHETCIGKRKWCPGSQTVRTQFMVANAFQTDVAFSFFQ